MRGTGFHDDITAEQYHQDPCRAPSLSSGIARIMLDQSARHAWCAHPRLGLVHEDEEPSRQMQIGTAAHKIILGRGRDIVVIEAPDYRKTEAKAARTRAIAEGKAPILAGDHANVLKLAESFAEQIGQIEDCEGFSEAAPELVAIAEDATGAWLRCMIDKYEDRGSSAVIWDLKTTGENAAPASIGRKVANMGYEVQAALYERVVATIRPELAGRIAFRFAFIETGPPNLLTIAELDPAGIAIGRRKVAAAIAMWNRCIEANTWPGYPSKIIRAEYPAFAETAWLSREEGDMRPFYTGNDPFMNLAVWHPPRRPKHEILPEIVL